MSECVIITLEVHGKGTWCNVNDVLPWEATLVEALLMKFEKWGGGGKAGGGAGMGFHMWMLYEKTVREVVELGQWPVKYWWNKVLLG